MPGLLYTIYAVAILLVAVGGSLAVVFGTPNAAGRSDRRYEALTIIGTLFVLALVVDFLL